MLTYNPDNLSIVIERPIEIKETLGIYNRRNLDKKLKSKLRKNSKKES